MDKTIILSCLIAFPLIVFFVPQDAFSISFLEVAKVAPTDLPIGQQFAFSISFSGDTIVVGIRLDDDAGPRSGSIDVFRGSGTTWTEEAKLTASDGTPGDQFGFSVGISGDTLVIGARFDDDKGSRAGSAYVFTRDGTTWTEEAKLTASDAAAGDWFGNSVAISGNTIVVGARSSDDAGANSGSAYVFTRSGTTWTEEAKLTASDAAAGDLFGNSDGISGDTIIIAAQHNDDAGSNSGSAYVFTKSGKTWSEEAKHVASDASADDRFGSQVAISGGTVLVGARLNDDAGSDSGSAYVFTRSGTTWTEETKLTASDAAAGDRFGSTVAISGDIIAVGARNNDDIGESSGAAYVFTRSGTTWTEGAKLMASDAATGDLFGFSVGISGNTVVVGAQADDNAGSAYVFGNPFLEVNIDIKPGSFPNCFNNNDKGNIPVAILSSAVFDATTVDPSTILLDGLSVIVKGKNGKFQTSIADINEDGFDDLIVHVKDVEDVFTLGTQDATLIGETFGGQDIGGTDSICIKEDSKGGKGKGGNKKPKESNE